MSTPESQFAKAAFYVSIASLLIATIFSYKSCNESATKEWQMKMDTSLLRIDSINQISLINLRDLNDSAGKSIDNLVALNTRTDFSIRRLTDLDIKAQTQIRELSNTVQHLKSIDSITLNQFKDEHILFHDFMERAMIDSKIDSSAFVVSRSYLFTMIDDVSNEIRYLYIDRSSYDSKTKMKLLKDYLERVRQFLIGMTVNRYLYRQPVIINSIVSYINSISDIYEMLHDDEATTEYALLYLPDVLWYSKIVTTNDPYCKDSVSHIFGRAIGVIKSHSLMPQKRP
jgi:hypothetical protein